MFNRFFVVFAAAAFFPLMVTAQINVTYSDFTNLLQLGAGLTLYQDTTTNTLNIGSTGATSWDFSQLKKHVSNKMQSMNPASTPYINLFPDANYCFFGNEAPYAGTYTYYEYYKLVQTGFYGLGQYERYVSPSGEVYTNQTMSIPGSLQYKFPLTVNDTWTAAFTDTITETNNLLVNKYYKVNNYTYVADAYGSMILPGGKTVQALRLRRFSRQIKYKPAGGSNYSSWVSYEFFAKTGESVSVRAADTNAAASGTISVTDVMISEIKPVGITDDDGVANAFFLSQNYPNPFNPVTVIQYRVPGNSSSVKAKTILRVYDLLGAEVATLADGYAAPGLYSASFDGSSLPSGIYFCELRSNGFTAARKLTLIK